MQWDSEIRDFKNFLKLERGLSENSIEAYLRDITKLKEFCQGDENSLAIETVTAQTLTTFLVTLNQFGLSAHSQARIISGIKAFYKYLIIYRRLYQY